MEKFGIITFFILDIMLQSDTHRVKSSRGRKGQDPFDPPESIIETNWLAAYNQFKAKQLHMKKEAGQGRGGFKNNRGGRGNQGGRGMGGRGRGHMGHGQNRGGHGGPPRGGHGGYNNGNFRGGPRGGHRGGGGGYGGPPRGGYGHGPVARGGYNNGKSCKSLDFIFIYFQVLLKVDGILDHLVTVHQTMDMAAATVVVMAVVITNHRAVVVDMVVHQWVVVAVAAVITKETAVEVVVVVAVPIAADKIIEAVLVHTELLSFSPPLCFVLG